MIYFSIAATKRNTWFHRLYLVFQLPVTGVALAGITGMWLAKYFDISTRLDVWEFLGLSTLFLVPAVFLWFFYRLVLFIGFGRAAFS